VTSISGGASSALLGAETEHSSVRLLAGRLLAIGSKRNSAALSRGFRSVAPAAASRALLLRFPTGSKQKPGSRPTCRPRCLPVREGSHLKHLVLTAPFSQKQQSILETVHDRLLVRIELRNAQTR
jgi:hypothetical protein